MTTGRVIARSAIIEVREDGVTCLLCKRDFEQAGTHFARVHKLQLHKGMSKTDRLRVYGLPLGTRLSSSRLRDDSRRRLPRGELPGRHTIGSSEEASALSKMQIRGVAPSAKQIDAPLRLLREGRHGGQWKRENWREERPCKSCGKSFNVERLSPRVTCGTKCGAKHAQSSREAAYEVIRKSVASLWEAGDSYSQIASKRGVTYSAVWLIVNKMLSSGRLKRPPGEPLRLTVTSV